MTTILPFPPDFNILCSRIPKLCATTWMEFKSAMENLFLHTGCDYLIDATPSTCIPPQCSKLDMWLLCAVYPNVDEEFMLQTQDNMSTLHTWITLCHLHDPPSVVPTAQPVVTTPIPDDSYASIRTSPPDLAPIIPSPPSVIPFLTSPTLPSIPIFNSYSAGSAYASKKHFTLSTVHGFKKHFAAMPSPSEDFQYEVYLYCAKWLVQVPGPGPPLPMDIIKTPLHC
jgi:hypothetical protein